MEENDIEKLPFLKLDQVGVVVRDIEKAVEYYQALGIGPFEPSKGDLIEREVDGKPVDDVKNLGMKANMGQVQFELIQPISGESVQKKFLEIRGEGINHLGFCVDDLEKEMAKLVKKGFKVISSGKHPGGGAFAYFDTDKVGGVIFELYQKPSR